MKNFADIRMKRDQFLVDIRKEDLHDRIANSRHRINEIKIEADSNVILETRSEYQSQFKCFKSDIECALSDNFTAQAAITKNIRILMSSFDKPENVPNREFQESGLQEYIMSFLQDKYDFHENQQSESMWVLSNFVCGDFTVIKEVLGSTNLLEMVARFLQKNTKKGLFENALHVIGNVTDSGKENIIRERLIQNGVFNQIQETITSIFENDTNPNINSEVLKDLEVKVQNLRLIKLAIWIFANLMKGNPYPPEQYYESLYQPVSSFIVKILQSGMDIEQCQECLYCLLNFVEGEKDTTDSRRIDFLMSNPNFEQTLVNIGLNTVNNGSKSSNELVFTLLKLIAFIINFDYDKENNYISRLIVANVFEFLVIALSINFRKVERYAAFIISNLFTEDTNVFYELIEQNETYMIKVLQKLIQSQIFSTKIELIYVLFNFTIASNFCKVLEFCTKYKDIVFYGILDCLSPENHPKIIFVALDTLKNQLNIGIMYSEKTNNDCNQVLEEQLLQNNIKNLEYLQNHENRGVCSKVRDQLDNFMLVEE